jgi:hypothetical protein
MDHLVQVADSFVDIDVDRVERLRQIAGGKKSSPHVFHVIFADRIGKDWKQVIDPGP